MCHFIVSSHYRDNERDCISLTKRRAAREWGPLFRFRDKKERRVASKVFRFSFHLLAASVLCWPIRCIAPVAKVKTICICAVSKFFRYTSEIHTSSYRSQRRTSFNLNQWQFELTISQTNSFFKSDLMRMTLLILRLLDVTAILKDAN